MDAINEDALVAFVFSYYHQSLLGSERAMRFVAALRFDDPGLVEHLYLGYADRTLGQQLPSDTTATGAAVRGMLRRLGLLKASGHEYLRGCVVLPLFHNDRRILGAYAFQVDIFEKQKRLESVSWVRHVTERQP
jgi:hypothetical protein